MSDFLYWLGISFIVSTICGFLLLVGVLSCSVYKLGWQATFDSDPWYVHLGYLIGLSFVILPWGLIDGIYVGFKILLNRITDDSP